jgi:hypothetical protein
MLLRTLSTDTLLTITLPNLSRADMLIVVEEVLKTFLGAFNSDDVSGDATSGCTTTDHVNNLTPPAIIAAVYLPLTVVTKLPAFNARETV